VGDGVGVGTGVGEGVGAGGGPGVLIAPPPLPPPPPQPATARRAAQAQPIFQRAVRCMPVMSVTSPKVARNLHERVEDWMNALFAQVQRPSATSVPLPLSPHTASALRRDAIREPHAMSADLQAAIEAAWERRAEVTPGSADVREAVEAAIELLDSGTARVAEPDGAGGWRVNQWLKKAVLLSFRLADNTVIEGGSASAPAYDKVPLKFTGWGENRFRDAGFRVVPGAVVRRGSFIGKGVVVMPSFVNIGAHVGEGTMVDTWVTVGSCAQIGKHVHLSGGVGIGGVLEPLQAGPVVIEDGCFIGARSEVVEGVRVCEGAVLSMGVFIGASTKIVDRKTGEIHVGRVPPYAVVVPGSLPGKPLPDGSPGPGLYCAVIVKTVDAQTRAKTGINDLLRD
jgi:2,3,4,5-tetrahydropyridine-2,6-dicarboxylate N-succinyltransferase